MADGKIILKTVFGGYVKLSKHHRRDGRKKSASTYTFYDHAAVPVPRTPSNINNMFRVRGLAIPVVKIV